ncbi:MAG TPA: Flp family type IVb pilin [Alphaproteobacteria bacterium]|nr:Flp family type IVb pilin [Alphaproteobacteria bacterium]
MVQLKARAAAFADDEIGAVAIEYGLILALIAIAAIAAFNLFGNGLQNLFGAVENRTTDVLDNANI